MSLDVLTPLKTAEMAQEMERASWLRNKQFWEDQFGPVSRAFMPQVQEMLTPQWEDRFKRDLYEAAGVGAKMSEQSALETLKQKAQAAPRTMSGKAYTKGVKDIQKQSGDSTATAFASAKANAKLVGPNMALSFLGRNPNYPATAGYGPTVAPNPEFAKMAGEGLGKVINWGAKGYNAMFGDRPGAVYSRPDFDVSDKYYKDLSDAASNFSWD